MNFGEHQWHLAIYDHIAHGCCERLNNWANIPSSSPHVTCRNTKWKHEGLGCQHALPSHNDLTSLALRSVWKTREAAFIQSCGEERKQQKTNKTWREVSRSKCQRERTLETSNRSAILNWSMKYAPRRESWNKSGPNKALRERERDRRWKARDKRGDRKGFYAKCGLTVLEFHRLGSDLNTQLSVWRGHKVVLSFSIEGVVEAIKRNDMRIPEDYTCEKHRTDSFTSDGDVHSGCRHLRQAAVGILWIWTVFQHRYASMLLAVRFIASEQRAGLSPQLQSVILLVLLKTLTSFCRAQRDTVQHSH